jgi:hypothetical protein
MEHSHQIIWHYIFVCVWKQPNQDMNSINSYFWHKAITSENFNLQNSLMVKEVD